MTHSHSTLHLCLRGLALGLGVSLAIAGPVLAEHEPPAIGLVAVDQDGPFFDLQMDPGESRELEVELSNKGHSEVIARTYAADAYSIIGGGFGTELFDEEPSGTTLWVDYPTRELNLPPEEGLVIEFTVTVPADAAPGQYITGVVVENSEPYRDPDAGEGIQFDQVNRTAIAIAIDVPGPREPSLEIGAIGHKVAAGMSFVTFEIANTGNVHLKPAGEFTLRDAAGEPIATYEPVMDSLYAGTETLLEAPLSAELAPGEYCAELSLADEETGAADETECLPFTVAAPDAGEGGASGPGGQTIPLVQPVIDAVAQDPRLLGALLLGVAVIGFVLLLVLRRRAVMRARRDRRRGEV